MGLAEALSGVGGEGGSGRGSPWLALTCSFKCPSFKVSSPESQATPPHSPVQVPWTPASSDGSVPEDSVLPAAGRGAGLAGLRPPPPAGEDGHALLLAEASVGAVARLDLLAHAALALDHLQ